MNAVKSLIPLINDVLVGGTIGAFAAGLFFAGGPVGIAAGASIGVVIGLWAGDVARNTSEPDLDNDFSSEETPPASKGG